jgi:hypothetical protein
MQGEGSEAGALVCPYCGARAESKPPYPVRYCHCRAGRGEAQGAVVKRR